PFSLTSSFIRRSHQEWKQWKVICRREVQNGQTKTKTLEVEDAPIDALPAQQLFIELKVDEREAFLCSLCYSQLPSLGSKTV
ncbi:hypothetical protein FRX31_009378, partial [Thalictrum thalictroides]